MRFSFFFPVNERSGYKCTTLFEEKEHQIKLLIRRVERESTKLLERVKQSHAWQLSASSPCLQLASNILSLYVCLIKNNRVRVPVSAHSRTFPTYLPNKIKITNLKRIWFKLLHTVCSMGYDKFVPFCIPGCYHTHNFFSFTVTIYGDVPRSPPYFGVACTFPLCNRKNWYIYVLQNCR